MPLSFNQIAVSLSKDNTLSISDISANLNFKSFIEVNVLCNTGYTTLSKV